MSLKAEAPRQLTRPGPHSKQGAARAGSRCAKPLHFHCPLSSSPVPFSPTPTPTPLSQKGNVSLSKARLSGGSKEGQGTGFPESGRVLRREGEGRWSGAGTEGPKGLGTMPGRGTIEGRRWEGCLLRPMAPLQFVGLGSRTHTLQDSARAAQFGLCASTPALGSHGNGVPTEAARDQAAPRFLRSGGAAR